MDLVYLYEIIITDYEKPEIFYISVWECELFGGSLNYLSLPKK